MKISVPRIHFNTERAPKRSGGSKLRAAQPLKVDRPSVLRTALLLLTTWYAGVVCEFSIASEKTMRFYCGTYTTRLGHVDGAAEAIGIFEIASDDGELQLVGHSPAIANSSHMCAGRNGKFLYVISEITDYHGREDGCLTVFAVDPTSGALQSLQTVSSAGPGPAYVSLDRSGKFLLLANYVAGNVVVYPIQEDGLLGDPTANEAHAGNSVNTDRQENPHPHCIVASPDNKFVLAPDLGIDRIVLYRFDAATGSLDPTPARDFATPPGSGPRHLEFSPNSTLAFCTYELTSELVVLKYGDGHLSELQRVSTLPDGFAGSSTNAEVRVAPDGKHVYVSNRGHDSLACFAISSDAGGVRLIGHVSTQGETPRNFGISPDGAWIVVGNQDSHTLAVFRRDAESGNLASAGAPIDSPSPALIYFPRAPGKP